MKKYLYLALLLASALNAAVPIEKTTCIVKTRGELAIKADVYRKLDKTVRPVILWLHGGALIFGHRGNLLRWQADQYVNAGYIVVAADYRLAPESKLPDILDDLRDAYRWIREQGPSLFYADPARVIVVGHSAGAYLALMGGFILEPRPSALVCFYGFGDITGAWQTHPAPLPPGQKPVTKAEAYSTIGTRPLAGTDFPHERSRFYAYTRQQGIWPQVVTGIDAVFDHQRFLHFCPLDNIDSRYPPTLLLHGDTDTDVPFAQSELMRRTLAARSVKSDLIRISGGEHMFDRNEKDPQVIAAFQTILAFLNANVNSP